MVDIIKKELMIRYIAKEDIKRINELINVLLLTLF